MSNVLRKGERERKDELTRRQDEEVGVDSRHIASFVRLVEDLKRVFPVASTASTGQVTNWVLVVRRKLMETEPGIFHELCAFRNIK